MSVKKAKKFICLFLAALLVCALGGCSAMRGRTDRYDGYTVRTEKAREERDEPRAQAPARASDSGEAQDYVLNKSSHKFHDPDCSGALDIKEKNRWDYRGTRQSVVDMGYEPCKICNP